jgi:hypothetical protein
VRRRENPKWRELLDLPQQDFRNVFVRFFPFETYMKGVSLSKP